MQLLAATCSLLALASMASCRAIGPRAGFDHKFYEIPCLETHASNGRPGTNPNTTISFQFHDPNTNTTALCTATFAPSTPNATFYPTARTSCHPDGHFGWSFASFDGIAAPFTLDLQHTYQDSQVGQPPWDHITTFGGANVTVGPDYVCASGATGGADCAIPSGKGPIEGPITEAIAKK